MEPLLRVPTVAAGVESLGKAIRPSVAVPPPQLTTIIAKGCYCHSVSRRRSDL